MEINYQALGQKVKHVRQQQGMTQEYLAEMVDLSVSHISNVETAKTKVALPTLVKIANAFGVTVDYLISDSYSQKQQRDVFSKELEAVIEQCSAKDRTIVLETAKCLSRILQDK